MVKFYYIAELIKRVEACIKNGVCFRSDDAIYGRLSLTLWELAEDIREGVDGTGTIMQIAIYAIIALVDLDSRFED